MWVVIILVCAVFGLVSQPVNKYIKKKVSSKWLAFVITFFVYWVILMGLYGIAALLGYDIFK